MTAVTCDLVAFYQRRYRAGQLAILLYRDFVALEDAKDYFWYTQGNYDQWGYDRQGRSYEQYTETTSELDDVLEDDMVREAEKYGGVWGQ